MQRNYFLNTFQEPHYDETENPRFGGVETSNVFNFSQILLSTTNEYGQQLSHNFQEFYMRSEDFPSLTESRVNKSVNYKHNVSKTKIVEPSNQQTGEMYEIGEETNKTSKSTHKNKFNSVLNDQYGIKAWYTGFSSENENDDKFLLTRGLDLDKMGLDLNSTTSLHKNFFSAFENNTFNTLDTDYNVPEEYLFDFAIRSQLDPLKFRFCIDDVLFFLFYTFIGEALQMYAAMELYLRQWRYHIELKVWFKAANARLERTTTHESGYYLFFNPQLWKIISRTYCIELAKVERKPKFLNVYTRLIFNTSRQSNQGKQY